MGKIGLIIRREYFTRIKNRTFIVMCLLGPLLWAGLFIAPVLLANKTGKKRHIVVVDMTKTPKEDATYAFIFRDTLNMHFDYSHVYDDVDAIKKKYKDSTFISVLEIPANFMDASDSLGDSTGVGGVGHTTILHSQIEPSKNMMAYIEARLTQVFRRDIMLHDSIPESALNILGQKISILSKVRGEGVELSQVKFIAGALFSFVIYMFIFLYGVQVMRGVIEEKTTRIVEVIISSVRPFQLMMGKIIGVAMVGLTQIVIWVVLSTVIIYPIVTAINNEKLDYTQLQQPGKLMPIQDKGLFDFHVSDVTKDIVKILLTVEWGTLLVAFFFYFILGYLMYAAIFAAVGSAVDAEADTQQFMIPVSIPLIFSLVMWQTILNDPNGTTARIMSYIPFTSPITMLMRLPFNGVSVVELTVSLCILAASFVGMTWVAGKIYRTGILMYGKKISWRELGKWLFYKT